MDATGIDKAKRISYIEILYIERKLKTHRDAMLEVFLLDQSM